ncbi:MAG: aspartate carbamoyltransferase regulatory subunit [Candidatus Brocadiia bacterium]
MASDNDTAQESERPHLDVSAIREGTVIDHIQNEVTFKVADILSLDQEDRMVLVGMNLPSGKVGKKGLIKIAGRALTPQEVNKIALIAPDATLNIIRDYTVAEKRRVELPESVEGIVRCINPNCITNQQPVTTSFEIMDSVPVALRCTYCERTIGADDIILK